MILWFVLIGVVFLAIFGLMLGFFVTFLRKKAKSVRCWIIHDDGSAVKKDFDKAPESFTFEKNRYIYDERATVRMMGLKQLFFKRGISEPLMLFNVKNPRPLTSGEYESIIKAQVHAELFGASEIGLIKTLMIFALVGIGITLALAGLILLTGSPDTMILSGDEATRAIIRESVREAIGR